MNEPEQKNQPGPIARFLRLGKEAIRNIPHPGWYKSKRRHEVGDGISSITDGMSSYKEVCDAAVSDEAAFANFRRHPEIRAIIETADGDLGRECLNLAAGMNPEIVSVLEVFRGSESCGDPEVWQMGDFGKFSGTTARYIFYLVELTDFFGSLDDMNIVEIGGGYGGQCKIIHDFFRPKSYTIVDIPPALGLARKFLEQFGCRDVSFKTSDELTEDLRFDLAISNYAFTECNEDIQRHYLNTLLKKSDRGYLKCNYEKKNLGFPKYSKTRLMEELPGSKEAPHLPEYPGNWTLVWGVG